MVHNPLLSFDLDTAKNIVILCGYQIQFIIYLYLILHHKIGYEPNSMERHITPISIHGEAYIEIEFNTKIYEEYKENK